MKKVLISLFVIVVFLVVGQDVDAQRKRKRKFKKEDTGTSAQKPAMSNQQQSNVGKLKADLEAIKAGSQVTQAQVNQLKNDLMNMVDGANKPSQSSVHKLAQDLADAVADGNLSPREIDKLMKDIEAVFESASLPASEVNAAITSAKAILTASGITKNDVQTIGNDLKTIADELQNNVSKAKTKLGGEASEKKKKFRRRK